MADPYSYDPPSDDDVTSDPDIALRLSGLMSPASAQSLVLPPSATPGQSGAGQTTPITGNLATAPSQAQPRVSGPAMLPGVAAKPESLGPGAQLLRAGITPTKPLGPNGPSLSDTKGVAAGSPLSDLHPSRSGVAAAIAQQPSAAYRQVPLQNAGLNSIPGYNRASTLLAITPSQPATASTPTQSLQQRWSGILNRNPQTRQAALINAGGPSRSLPALQTSGGGPNLGTPTSQSVIAPRGTFPGDQNEVGRLLSTGSGVSQIKNPVVQDIARVGDVALSALTPGWAQWAPGTTANHQRLLNQAEGRVSNDEDQLKNAAALADTQSQTTERNAQADQANSKANYYRPVNLTPEQAVSIGQPALAGSPMDARDFARLQEAYGRDQTNLQLRTGGQARTLSASDAAAIGMPSLAGATMSNDEYQRTLQQQQRNTQSGANNTANNQTRVTTTGMRDATSTANNERTHAGKGGTGAPKPIPAATKDRIESQKNTAINKARADFDSGASSQDDYLNAWQQAQDDYEQRIGAQTGQPVPHLDIRSNVDRNGNWIGTRQGSIQQPARQPAQQRTQQSGATFKSKTGSKVAVGDPVEVNGRVGKVSGIIPKTGKVQVQWAAR